MLIHDHVYCNLCCQDMGQLHSQPAIAPDLIDDQRTAPHFAVCPECLDASEVVDIEHKGQAA